MVRFIKLDLINILNAVYRIVDVTTFNKLVVNGQRSVFEDQLEK